ncbi:MAG: hypothetical protein GY913_16435 [Proteobacteria bacterium]|nr:hypothetical protein [Pseudomonadota bacterium]MCP4918493.1 hypothetical protein [Pseudomonadota bacterium]
MVGWADGNLLLLSDVFDEQRALVEVDPEDPWFDALVQRTEHRPGMELIGAARGVKNSSAVGSRRRPNEC